MNCRRARVFLIPVLFLAAAQTRADFIRIEENDPAVTYTGNWTTYTRTNLSGGSLVAGALGSTATVTFTGTGIHWIEYFSNRVRGGANIYLDGALVAQVPARESGIIDVYGEKQYRYGLTGLADTTHVMTIEGTGARFNFPPNITIDVFYVERGGVTRLIQESDTAVTYTGTWVEFDDPGVSGGSVLASREAGATATVNFSGNAISWLSYACPCAAGIARVTSPFSNNPMTRTAYSTERHAQVPIYNIGWSIASLSEERQLRIEVTGDSAADNPWVVVDAFRIQTGSSDGPDTTPPEITIREPQNGATVTGRIPLNSDAFDNVGQHAVNIRYFVDGVEIERDTTRSVTRLTSDTWWTTAGMGVNGHMVTPVSDGPHVLTAVARDFAGNETHSAPINVMVSNPVPLIELLAPPSPLTGMATLNVETSGQFNTAAGVTFWARGMDDVLYNLGTDTTTPYSITRDTSSIPDGRQFFVWAEIFDLYGSRITTDTWHVHIDH